MMCNQFVMRSFILIFLVIFISCNRERQEEDKTVIRYSKESLQEVNKILVEKDAEIIKSYVERRGWGMQVSETGLWHMIYKKGNGDNVKKGDYITINYEVRLIDGTLCYSSDSLGLKSFVVGKGGVEAGLEAGVLMLQKGSKARFILPPHLAHGLIGDENMIPARAIIIYDVEILKIEY